MDSVLLKAIEKGMQYTQANNRDFIRISGDGIYANTLGCAMLELIDYANVSPMDLIDELSVVSNFDLMQLVPHPLGLGMMYYYAVLGSLEFRYGWTREMCLEWMYGTSTDTQT